MSTLSPRGACLQWQPELLWLNAASDAMLACAFFAMAFVFAVFVWRRRSHMLLMFRALFGGFAVFALMAGLSSLLAVLTLWVPAYGIEAAVKGALTPVSAMIGGALLWAMPRFMTMPTRVQLQQAYEALQEETRKRRRAEAMVRRFQEMEASEAQVRQVQKMEAIGQLTGGIAHDFNNILTVITGSIDMLVDGVKDRPLLARIATMIGNAANRGADLTQRLLAFARQQPLQPRSTDINNLVVDTARLLRPTLGEQIEIESMLADDCAPALVDASQLSTALLNLALNARDAMPNGGKLTLESGNVVLDADAARRVGDVPPGRYVMIAVRDTGEGIPGSVLDRVFEPFFTTKEVGKGSGLGLSMVYGFVRQSNGSIRLDSERGHGTTVKLYLPQADHAPEDHEENAFGGLAMAETLRGDETILIVEDDVMVRDYVVAQIERLGYRTFAAADAEEALAIIDGAEPIDLLFTDVIMPGGMNGRQLAIEAQRRRPQLKVLYTSGYAENAIVHQGRLDAGVRLLPKPYRSSELAQGIRMALAA
jgi:signal transduction histidine kinase/CheY-like chemotaxis protein